MPFYVLPVEKTAGDSQKYYINLPVAMCRYFDLVPNSSFKCYLAKGKSIKMQLGWTTEGKRISVMRPPDLYISFLPLNEIQKELFSEGEPRIWPQACYFEATIPLPLGDRLGSLALLAAVFEKRGINIERVSTFLGADSDHAYATIMVNRPNNKEKNEAESPSVMSPEDLSKILWEGLFEVLGSDKEWISGTSENLRVLIEVLLYYFSTDRSNDAKNNLKNLICNAIDKRRSDTERTFLKKATDIMARRFVPHPNYLDSQYPQFSPIGTWEYGKPGKHQLMLPDDLIAAFQKSYTDPKIIDSLREHYKTVFAVNDDSVPELAVPRYAYLRPQVRSSLFSVRLISAFARPIMVKLDVNNVHGRFAVIAQWFKENNLSLRWFEAYPLDSKRSTIWICADIHSLLASRKDNRETYTEACTRIFRSLHNDLLSEKAYSEMKDSYDKYYPQEASLEKQLTKEKTKEIYKSELIEIYPGEFSDKSVKANNAIKDVQDYFSKFLHDSRLSDEIFKKKDLVWHNFIDAMGISNRWRFNVHAPALVYCRPGERNYKRFKDNNEKSLAYYADYFEHRLLKSNSFNDVRLGDASESLFNYYKRLGRIKAFTNSGPWKRAAEIMFPNFALHDFDHCQRVLQYAYFMLDGLYISTEECFILAAAVYLHDIGMGDPQRIETTVNIKDSLQRKRNLNDIRYDHADRSAQLAYNTWVGWPKLLELKNEYEDRKKLDEMTVAHCNNTTIFKADEYGVHPLHWPNLDPNNAFTSIPKLEDKDHFRFLDDATKCGLPDDKTTYSMFRDSTIACTALNRERRLISKVIKAHNRGYNIQDRIWDRPPMWSEIYDDIRWLCDSRKVDYQRLFKMIRYYVDNTMHCRIRLLAAILRIADGLDYAIERVPKKDVNDNLHAVIKNTPGRGTITDTKNRYDTRVQLISEKDEQEYTLNSSVSHIIIDSAGKRIIVLVKPLSETRKDEWGGRYEEVWRKEEIKSKYSTYMLAGIIEKRINDELDSVSSVLDEYGVSRYSVSVKQLKEDENIPCEFIT